MATQRHIPVSSIIDEQTCRLLSVIRRKDDADAAVRKLLDTNGRQARGLSDEDNTKQALDVLLEAYYRSTELLCVLKADMPQPELSMCRIAEHVKAASNSSTIVSSNPQNQQGSTWKTTLTKERALEVILANSEPSAASSEQSPSHSSGPQSSNGMTNQAANLSEKSNNNSAVAHEASSFLKDRNGSWPLRKNKHTPDASNGGMSSNKHMFGGQTYNSETVSVHSEFNTQWSEPRRFPDQSHSGLGQQQPVTNGITSRERKAPRTYGRASKGVNDNHGEEYHQPSRGLVHRYTNNHQADSPEDEDRRIPFVTARDQLQMENAKNGHRSNVRRSQGSFAGGNPGNGQGGRSWNPAASLRNSVPSVTGMQRGNEEQKKTLGVKRRFVPPFKKESDDDQSREPSRPFYGGARPGRTSSAGLHQNRLSAANRNVSHQDQGEEEMDPRLKNCDPALIERIENEIIDRGEKIVFADIAGLDFAKKCVQELVIWPISRPDLFTGLRTLPKGLLLFGPPGTGKTLIGKAIACESQATFFNISASSLTSKWIGEGEKLVRTLFAVASCNQPAVIFIDEIDSLLTQRSSDENEASRRIKTEFLVQLDGAGTSSNDRILVVGATNRPQELDEAARRRFVKRLYIPLPTREARKSLIVQLLQKNVHELKDEDVENVVDRCAGFSGADVRSLCTEAAMGPIRSCTDIRLMNADEVRPINMQDFSVALETVRPSVSDKDLTHYMEWNTEFGSFQIDRM